MVAAVKVLAGVRPAETRCDELDRRIAQSCAWVAADTITGRFVPEEDDLEEDHENCRQVARIIIQAIKSYASHELTEQCRRELRQEEASRRQRAKEARQRGSEIPF
jgi:hypothetical protein